MGKKIDYIFNPAIEHVYEGEWKDDKKNGQGTHLSSNGSVYEVGEFREGKFYNGKQYWEEGYTKIENGKRVKKISEKSLLGKFLDKINE